jgi:hypothetical protein
MYGRPVGSDFREVEMGRKLAVALIVLAASRLPFIQHEGKRVAVDQAPRFQSSLAALLVKFELLRRKWDSKQLSPEVNGEKTTNKSAWDPAARSITTDANRLQNQELSEKSPVDSTAPGPERGNNGALPVEVLKRTQEKAGPDWLRRLGFNAGDWGLEKDEELADFILKRLGFQKEEVEERSARFRKHSRATEAEEARQREPQHGDAGALQLDDTGSELFAIDSDGDGRVEASPGAREETKEGETGSLGLVKDGYAGLKEKVGLQILQDIADPVIDLYKRAIAKGRHWAWRARRLSNMDLP